MKRCFSQIGVAVLALCAGMACSDGKKEQAFTQAKSQAQTKQIVVDTLVMKRCSFHKQIVCNGKLHAVMKSDLSFAGSGGVIQRIAVRNGDYVKAGATLAVLDTKEAEVELNKNRRGMEKARIDLSDRLIGLGYTADITDVPKAILQNAKATSGFDNAVDQLRASERNWANCFLKAPFGGRVANLDAKVFDRSKEQLLTLIDDSRFDVEFHVLEAELNEVSRGLRVKVSPFVQDDQTFVGEITEVNPLIDEKGQIKVRARVNNRGGVLVEGMNVKLVLEREVKNQFVVPKDAVVLRDGYQVVFLYEEGKAVWKYVDVVMSNIDYHVITGSAEKQTRLKEKDVVIVSNNLSLADGTEVVVNEHPADRTNP